MASCRQGLRRRLVLDRSLVAHKRTNPTEAELRIASNLPATAGLTLSRKGFSTFACNATQPLLGTHFNSLTQFSSAAKKKAARAGRRGPP